MNISHILSNTNSVSNLLLFIKQRNNVLVHFVESFKKFKLLASWRWSYFYELLVNTNQWRQKFATSCFRAYKNYFAFALEHNLNNLELHFSAKETKSFCLTYPVLIVLT